MLDQFTYEEYRQLISELKYKRKNICFSDFRNLNEPASYFILRHDVDFSLTAALSMAELESEIEVRATYFLLLRSQNYNLLSESCCSVPRMLVSLGHEVGLHYDVRAMSAMMIGGNKIPHKQLEYEADVLSWITGSPVQSIAMHNPSVYGDDPFAGDNHFINAYDPQYTKRIAYFSDSCGAWRDSTYHSFRNSNIPDRLQMLIHPFFWAETVGDRWERLRKWMGEAHQSLEERQRKTQKSWRNHIGVNEHENRRT